MKAMRATIKKILGVREYAKNKFITTIEFQDGGQKSTATAIGNNWKVGDKIYVWPHDKFGGKLKFFKDLS